MFSVHGETLYFLYFQPQTNEFREFSGIGTTWEHTIKLTPKNLTELCHKSPLYYHGGNMQVDQSFDLLTTIYDAQTTSTVGP